MLTIKKERDMPELPDVELVKKRLEKQITGKKFAQAKILREAAERKRNPNESTLNTRLFGREIKGVSRRGKFLILSANGEELIFHFRMTGDLLFARDKEPINENTRAIFGLSDSCELRFVDRRNIGEIYLTEKGKYGADNLKLLAKLGVEPLSKEFTFQYFDSILNKNSNKVIKVLLMDQRKIAGIGNIYSDEILFRAGLSPIRVTDSLSLQERKKLYQSIKDTLLAAIKDESKHAETFSTLDRDAFMCKKCGGKLVHEKIGGRTSVYCSEHQK